MITAAKIIQNQKNILSERAKCTFCFVLIKQNLAQNVLRKGNNLFCRLYKNKRQYNPLKKKFLSHIFFLTNKPSATNALQPHKQYSKKQLHRTTSPLSSYILPSHPPACIPPRMVPPAYFFLRQASARNEALRRADCLSVASFCPLAQ